MRAIRFRLRAELRTHWRGLVAVALLAGTAGGVALAAVAGARRTDTAYTRLSRATEAYDILVNPDLGTQSALTRRDVARLPQVDVVGRGDGLAVAMSRLQRPRDYAHLTTDLALASDGRLHLTFARPKLVDGRLPRADRPHEVFVDTVYADRTGIGVGDRVEALGVTTAEVAGVFYQPEETAAMVRRGELGVPLVMHVVGVGVVPDQIVYDEGFRLANVLFTPAFRARHPEIAVPFFGLGVRLKHGAADLPAFRRAVEGLVPDEAIAFQTAPVTEAKFDRAVQPYVGALTIFAIVVALTGMLLAGQALARQSFLAATDAPALFSLGISRTQLFVLAMLRVVLVAVGAAAITVVVAFACSPLLPLGPARTAEPNPGLAFDAFVLGGGALVVLGAVMLLGVWPAWRDARSGTPRAADAGPRPSRVAQTLAGAGASVPAVAGVRMALEPGRGRTAVPVRTTILALGLAITVVLAAAGVAASIDHLVDTPRLFGWNWDVKVEAAKYDQNENRRVRREIAQVLDRSSDVEAWSTVSLSDVRLERVGSIPAFGVSRARRDVAPTVVSGRLPRDDDEIALGQRTLRSLDGDVGSTVTARANDGSRVPLRVVGRVVLPGIGTYPGSDKTALGEGAVVTATALGELGPDFKRNDIVIRFVRGGTPAQRDRVLDGMARIVDPTDEDTFEVATVARPSDILSYEGVRSTPVVLGAVLAMLALASVVHALVTAVRRRRSDLAMLETLGFTGRQVSSTIAWQATTVGVAALVIGLPLGIALGRMSWTLLADDLGTVAEPIVPLAVVLLAVPVVLALVNLVAFVPGRMASRVRPATALRSE